MGEDFFTGVKGSFAGDSGETIPRAGVETVITTENAVADGTAKFFRNGAFVLDGEIGDAAPRIELVGRGEGLGRAGGLAGVARAAAIIPRLVHRQRGATGDGGAILDLDFDRLGPFSASEQPQLLPPNAEPFSQQHRRHLRHVAERVRAERGE